MRATREAAEVPSTADHGSADDDVAAGVKKRVIIPSKCVGATTTELTSEWPEMASSMGRPLSATRTAVRLCVPQRPTSSS